MTYFSFNTETQLRPVKFILSHKLVIYELNSMACKPENTFRQVKQVQHRKAEGWWNVKFLFFGALE